MKVKALKLCFAGSARRRPGDVFEMNWPEDKDLPAFLERVPDSEPEQKAEQAVEPPPEPVALSEVTKADAEADSEMEAFLK